ncbi:MAG: hypothetical protein PVI30_23345 [Myxococcales bacterium]|jgi:hypothetical protein
MDPYVSPELTRRLRSQQSSLRTALTALEHGASHARSPQLSAQCRSVTRLFRSYEGLVNALLEAVEPDRPAASAGLEFELPGDGFDETPG